MENFIDLKRKDNSKDLFGVDITPTYLLDDWFIVPPFSILDSSAGRWQSRKKRWVKIINDNAATRHNKLRGNNDAANKAFMSIKGTTTSILDPVLCEVLLHWFTEVGHNTLDPFAGDSAFGFVSSFKQRPFIGIELREEQVIVNKTLVDSMQLPAKYICDDSCNIDKHVPDDSIDFLFSCPPYCDLEIYSDSQNDLSNMSYDKFFDTIQYILSMCYNKLRDNRFAAIVIGEVRESNGHNYIGVVPKIINIMVGAGFNYYNEMILLTPVGNLMLRAGRYMNKNRKIGKQHQNVLIFYKGNPKNINKHFNNIKDGSGNV